MYTVDSFCLVRIWDFASGNCIKSYPLEVKYKAKIIMCEIDPNFEYLLVAFDNYII